MVKTGEKWLLISAAILAIAATAWNYANGYILAYGDTESHLNIAKRVTDSITPGLAQLGGIWLPLPHLLMIPFTKINFLYSTGLAGSIVSGVAYIVSCWYVYKITVLATNNRMAGLTAYIVFAANPNVLFMQSTAMTELPLVGFSLMSIYYFMKYLHEQENVLLLVLAGFFGWCTTLTRYDGWFLVAVQVVILIARMVHRGRVIMYATLAFSGIAAWLGWDGVILGDPLYFTNSPFSAKSQQKGWLTRGQLLTYHNLPLSVIYYAQTVEENLGWVITILAIIGLGWYLTDTILTYKWELVILLGVPVLFYVVTMYLGQSIILVPGLTPPHFEWHLFNIRYGLPMVPAAAIMTGYLAYRIPQLINGYWLNTGKHIIQVNSDTAMTARDWLGRMFQGGLWALIGFQIFLFMSGEQKVMVREDGINGLSSGLRYHQDAQQWMRQNYSGGKVLLDDFARTVSVIGSNIPMNQVIYIGNKPYWETSMQEPERYAQWIVLQKDDEVWKNIYDQPAVQSRLYRYFQKVYTSPEVLIFKRIDEVK